MYECSYLSMAEPTTIGRSMQLGPQFTQCCMTHKLFTNEPYAQHGCHRGQYYVKDRGTNDACAKHISYTYNRTVYLMNSALNEML